jgi:hypothetical protein
LGGLIADLLIRLAADRRKAMFGAVAAAIVFVLGAGITVLATSVLGWSGGLLIGVAMAAGLLAAGAALLLPQWTNQALDEGG